MSNKYLEKIAFRVGLLKNLYRGAVTSIKGMGSTVGRQYHNAFGGAYRDYAQKNFGITDPNRLAKMNAKEFGRQWRAKNPLPPNFTRSDIIGRNDNFNATIRKLRDQTYSGRINAGLLTGGAILGGSALVGRYGPNSQQGQNNAVYY